MAETQSASLASVSEKCLLCTPPTLLQCNVLIGIDHSRVLCTSLKNPNFSNLKYGVIQLLTIRWQYWSTTNNFQSGGGGVVWELFTVVTSDRALWQ